MPYADSIKCKQYKHEWYLKHKEETNRKALLWAKNNPEKRRQIVKVNNQRSKVRKRLWIEKQRYDGSATTVGKKCYICESPNSSFKSKCLHVHHIDGQNGKCGKKLNNSPENLIILCVSCHGKVHNKHHRKEFYEYKKDYTPA